MVYLILSVSSTVFAVGQHHNKGSYFYYWDTLLVAQLVEALRYKPEGRAFDSRLCHSNFSLTLSFLAYCGPGVDSASNRNEYQECFLG